MKNQIIRILEKHNVRNKFYIGSGAEAGLSYIHLKVDKWDRQLLTADCAIQYEPRTNSVVVWDIRKRIELSASLDLYIKRSMQWDMITHLQVIPVSIINRNSGHKSLVAVMPFEQFESFLLINKHIGFNIPVDSAVYDNDELKSLDIVDEGTEGISVYFYGERFEKDAKARAAAVAAQGCRCAICGFDYEKTYGEIGKDYIEVHHKKPAYDKAPLNPEEDLVCVCSNCHKMLHRGKKTTMTVEELRAAITK